MTGSRTSLWIAMAMVAATIVSTASILLRLVRLPFVEVDILGISNSPQHWLGWAGSLIILGTTTWYVYAKRVRHTPSANSLGLHAFGNLLGVSLVSIHFAQQVTRPATNYPSLGTGIVQYAATILLVATGLIAFFAYKPEWSRYYRFLHPAAAMTLLMSIILHILHDIYATAL